MKTGLYIHVPFCIRKCPYCDFYSVSSHSDDTYRKYTDAVLRNIRRYTSGYPGLKFDTVYFGGGTPSVMPAGFFSEILYENRGFITDDAEITMEMNPKTAAVSKLSAIRKSGVNRISVGIQSAVDSELTDLGRIHNFAEAAKAVSDARSSGFENISGDLMIGIKGQNADTLVQSVHSLAELELQHISGYLLKIEPGTEYFRNRVSGEVPDEDMSADLYLLAVKTLAERGYFQYEISNFSKPGYESRHNLRYWKSREYIGIGPSAHSYFDGKRFEVPRSLADFTAADIQSETINEENPGSFFEKAMLVLRLAGGLRKSDFPDEFRSVAERAGKFRNTGLINITEESISFTPEGFLVSNALISELLG